MWLRLALRRLGKKWEEVFERAEADFAGDCRTMLVLDMGFSGSKFSRRPKPAPKGATSCPLCCLSGDIREQGTHSATHNYQRYLFPCPCVFLALSR